LALANRLRCLLARRRSHGLTADGQLGIFARNFWMPAIMAWSAAIWSLLLLLVLIAFLLVGGCERTVPGGAPLPRLRVLSMGIAGSPRNSGRRTEEIDFVQDEFS
jgi:hypothetical protein